MPHRIPAWLEEIQTAIQNIDQYTTGRYNFAAYVADKMLRQAIEMNLIIIGETVNKILRKEPDIGITAARSIVNLRNLIIHTYDDVEDETIWNIVVNHLPRLKTEINKALEKY